MGRAIGVQFSVGASVQRTVASAFGTVSSRVKGLKGDLRDLEKQSKAANRLTAAMDKRTQIKAQYTANPTDELRAALTTANAAYGRAAAQARTYGVSVQNAAEAQALLSSRIERTRGALVRQQQLQANQEKRKEIHGQILGTAATAMTVVAPITLAMEFETAMADVRKVTDFDAAGLKTFSHELLNMSTRIPMAAADLTQIAAAAGQAGIAQNELLQFTEDAAVMGTAFNMAAADAGAAMTGMRTNFKLTQNGVRLLGDAINSLSNSYDAKAAELVDYTSRVGGTAANFKMTGEQVAALGAVFRATKVNTEEASTATNAMFVRLGNANKLGKDAEAAFRSVGLSGKQMANLMQKDAQGALMLFLRQVKQSKNPLAVLSAVLGTDHSPKIVKLVNSLDMYEEALQHVSDPAKYAGSQLEEFANVTDTAAARWKLATNAAAKAGIALGTAVLPALSSVLDTVSPWIGALGDFAAKYETVTTVVFGTASALIAFKVASLAGMYAATMISDAWTMASSVAEKLRWTSITSTAALVRQRAVMMYTATATRLAAAGQWLLNVAMTANPIGIVVMAVAALAAGFVYLYNKSETFRTAVSTVMTAVVKVFRTAAAVLILPYVMAWDGIKAVWGAVGPWFSQQWANISSGASAAWTAATGYASAAWSSVVSTWGTVSAYFNENFEAVSAVCGTVWNGISSTICGVWDSVRAKATELFDWLASKFEWLSTATNMVSTGWAKAKSLVGLDDEEGASAVATPATATAPSTAKAWYEFGWFGGDDESAPATAAQPMQTVAGPVEAVTQPMTTAPVEPEPQKPGAPASRTGATASQPPSAQASSARGNATGTTGNASTGAAVSLTQEITLNGITDADFARRVVDAVKARKGDFERLLSSIVDDQRRLAYGR